MPLSKYFVRNEYGLADPELYRSADKDDPEALLEAVAMAGLVGLLRQLGDLSEFAAEIFHDLHEEVMATAARGHGLMARVKQLEAEVPSLEKAFFSQTHHSSFFTNGGIDWHPNLQSEQNLITRGNLPRLIMDSYEECRGPPRLFLLDKFDVAGAGACLKRYTDPSFLKMESATVEVHREKRIRKFKQKKGARLRDREAPNAVPTHSKLHQLLLEERIENGYCNPARLVKLKKRQLNAPAVEAKSGKSYMKKFLESPSPDPKMICETSIFPLPARHTSDDTSEAGIKILEISSISPVKKSIGNENTCSYPNEQELEIKPFPEVVGETNGDLVKVKEQISLGANEMSFDLVNVSDETELVINEQRKIEGRLDGYCSDDVTSEVDNYVDALTTMESELETDNEFKPKESFFNIQKVTDNDKEHQLQTRFSDSPSFGDSSTSEDISSFKQERNEEHIEVKAQLSDSQSHSSTSDNNSSFRGDEDEHVEQQAHFSDSQSVENSQHPDSLSPMIEKIQSSPNLFTTTKYYDREIEKIQSAPNEKFVTHDDTHVHEQEISDSGQASFDLMTSGQAFCADSEPVASVTITTGTQSDETLFDAVEPNKRLDYEADRTGLVESVASSLVKGDACTVDCSDKISLDNLVDDDPHIHSGHSLQVSNDLELTDGDECIDQSEINIFQVESPKENSSEIPGCEDIVSKREDSVCPSIEELNLNSGLSPVPDCQGSNDEDCSIAHQLNLEDLSPNVEVPAVSCFTRGLSSGSIHSNPQDELESTEIDVRFSDLQSKYENLPKGVHGDEIIGSTCSIDPVQGDGHFKNPSPDIRVMVNGMATEIVESKDPPVYNVPSVESAENDMGINTCPASGLICSPSRSLSNVEEAVSASSDSYPMEMESNDVELTQISMDSNTGQRENQLASSVDTTSSDVIYSHMSNLLKLEESFSAIAIPNEKEMDAHKETARASLTELKWQKIVGRQETVSADVQVNPNKSVPCDLSDLKSNIQKSSPREKFQQSAFMDDVKMVPEFSGLDTRQSESMIYGQNDHLQNSRDSFSSPSCNQLESKTDLEPLLQSQVGEQDSEFLLKDKENFASEKSQSQQMQVYQLEQEGMHATTESVSEIQAAEPSIYSSPQSCGPGTNPTKYVMDPLKPLLPDFLPKATENNLDEMPPPMPPLPPMQWRTGKVQHASLDSQREELQVSQASIQPMQRVMPDKSQFGLPVSDGETLLYQNPFLPIMAVESDKFQHSSGFSVGFSGHPVAIPFQYPVMVNEAKSQYNYVVLDGNEIQNPFLTLPVVSTGMHPHYIVASEGEMAQTSNQYAPTQPAAYAVSGHDSISPQEEPSQHPTQLMTQTSADDKTLEQPKLYVESRDGVSNSHVIASEEEMVHDSIPPAECANSGHDSIYPVEKLTQSPSQLMTEISSDDTTLMQPMNNVVCMDRPPNGHIVTSEGEMEQNYTMCPPIPSAESAVSGHNSISQEKLTQPPSQLTTEASSEIKTPNQSVSNVQGEQGSLGMSLMLPPNMESMEPNQSFMPVEGEASSLITSAQTSDFENEMTNGKSKKLPRPRNPLIDAVVAHDKSKLKRVTERVMADIAPKADERDSLLEQIRTKSFNLKPAAATRPSIRGPSTNLKLAAILEKANAIRQALAGSDEDDDADSWSDS